MVVLGPERLATLATSLADQFALLYDARPLDPQAAFAGETLTFSFQGGLARSDEWLLEAGRCEDMREFREAFLGAIGPQLESVVASLSGNDVRHYFAAFELETRTTNCYFILTPGRQTEAEQRQALIDWSSQNRRDARLQRRRHDETRETHTRIQELIREHLQETAESPGRRREHAPEEEA